MVVVPAGRVVDGGLVPGAGAPLQADEFPARRGVVEDRAAPLGEEGFALQLGARLVAMVGVVPEGVALECLRDPVAPL